MSEKQAKKIKKVSQKQLKEIVVNLLAKKTLWGRIKLAFKIILCKI